MKLARVTPRFGGLPELQTFECRPCRETITEIIEDYRGDRSGRPPAQPKTLCVEMADVGAPSHDRMRKIKFIAVAAIVTLLGMPAFADSEYDAYAMLVGLTAYPSICKKLVREKELQEAMKAEAKRRGFDVTDPDNERLIALSSAKFYRNIYRTEENRPG